MPSNTLQFSDNSKSELIDLKRIIHLVFHFWYIIVLFALLGVGVAYLYNLFQQKVYQVDSKIIVPKKADDINIDAVFNISPTQTNLISVNNEVEILKSFKLNKRVAESLGWRTKWSKKDLFIWKGIYNQEPFKLVENNEDSNIEDVAVNITHLNDETFLISAKGTGYLKNRQVTIDFGETGKYGIPLKNEYFDFTLSLMPQRHIEHDEEYQVVFQNTDEIARSFSNNLTVKQVEENSEVIILKLNTNEPWRGIDYLNQLVKVYMDLKLEKKLEAQKKSIEFIKSQLSGISDSLYLSESNYSDYRSKNQLINLSTQGNLVLQVMGEIERDKNQMQMQLEYFHNVYSYLEKGDGIKQIVSPSVVGIQDVTFISLVQKLSDLYRNRDVLSFSSRDNNPQLVILNQEIKQVNKLLNENLVNLIKNVEASIKNLNKRYEQINAQLNNLPVKEQKLINIQKQYELTNEIYTFLLKKKAEIELSMASSVIDVQVVDPASMSRAVILGKPLSIILFLGAIIGMFIPVFILIIINALDNKIKVKADIQKYTAIPILGSVIHNKTNNELCVKSDPSSVIAESYRTIRTNIQYMIDTEKENVFGIHSVSNNEGKTFTAVNLATIFALNDKKTLLIGCDLRKPRLSKIFNISNNVGLTTALINQNTYEEVIFETLIDNLFVLPAGPIPPNPSELLDKPAFKELVNWCKRKFDYVILDNAPIYLVTDGLITSQLSDVNIFVLRSGVTSKDHIEIINDVTVHSILKKTSIIINDVSYANWGYGYGYGYGYHNQQETSPRK